MVSINMNQGHELPTLYVRSLDLPDFMGWAINSDHYIICRVTVRGKRAVTISEEKNRGEIFEGELQIVGIQALTNDPISNNALEAKDWSKEKAEVHDKRLN